MIDNTNKQLKELMKKHGLTRSAAARLCMVRDPSLDRWLAPRQREQRVGKAMGVQVDNPQYRRMPEHRLALLLSALRTKASDAEIAKTLESLNGH